MIQGQEAINRFALAPNQVLRRLQNIGIKSNDIIEPQVYSLLPNKSSFKHFYNKRFYKPSRSLEIKIYIYIGNTGRYTDANSKYFFMEVFHL
jgi:hypothetical protein